MWIAAGVFVCLILPNASLWAAANGDDAHHGPAPINWLSLDYKNKDAHGHPQEEGQQGHMPPPLVFALINFGLLLALLGWKAGPPLRRYAQSRKERIRDALEESERLRQAAQAKLDECTKKLASMDQEIATLITEMRKDAESEHARIIQQAEAQAETMIRDAKARIAGELQRATAKVSEEVLEQAVTIARNILTKRLTQTDQQSLIDAFIVDMKTATSGKESRT